MKSQLLGVPANQIFTFAKATERTMSRWRLWASAAALGLLCSLPSAQAQKLTILHSFEGPEGVSPRTGLVRDSAGNLYGTANYGGIFQNCDEELGGGTVFKVDTAGNTSALHAFNNDPDGCFPNALIIDAADNLYGTTPYSTSFRVNAEGGFTTFYSFRQFNQGSGPSGPLFRDSEGNLYGTASNGGDAECAQYYGCGTVFRLDSSGHVTVLYSFTGGAEGYSPQAGVIGDAAGNLYGTTTYGGDYTCELGCGAVFKLDPSGNLTVLHAFTGGADGGNSAATLIMDSAGNLYGDTPIGGDLSCADHYGCGTVFEINPNGTKTILYSFAGGTDGRLPTTGLARDAAGNIYGTTETGGSEGNGTVFKLDKSGHETVLYRFNGIDAALPWAGVILDSAGNLYGTTAYGGSYQSGTVFKLTQ